MGKPAQEWTYGDLDAGFKDAKVVLDESFVIGAQGAPLHGAALGHGVLAERQGASCSARLAEPVVRRCPASRATAASSRRTSSTSRSIAAAASAPRARAYPQMAIPAHMSRKLNGRPVMMRVTRARGILPSARPRRLPGPHQGRLRAPTAASPPSTSTWWPENGANIGLLGFRELRPHAVGRLSAAGDALARHSGAHQHADRAGRSAAPARTRPRSRWSR